MREDEAKRMETIRDDVHSLLAALTPQEAKALRARLGIIEATDRVADEDEGTLRALARALAILKNKKEAVMDRRRRRSDGRLAAANSRHRST
jgi:DNA-directed RNA polymerase sigma subunit (sigma70/sigma32)